jgi:hypothetical protein
MDPTIKALQDKYTKAEVKYVDKSHHEWHHCGICEYFRKPSSCKIVEGTIRAEGGCNKFEEKK